MNIAASYLIRFYINNNTLYNSTKNKFLELLFYSLETTGQVISVTNNDLSQAYSMSLSILVTPNSQIYTSHQLCNPLHLIHFLINEYQRITNPSINKDNYISTQLTM